MAYQPEGFFLLFAQLRGEGVNEIVWIIGLGGGGVGGGGGGWGGGGGGQVHICVQRFELCTETMSAVYTVPKPEVNCFVDI